MNFRKSFLDEADREIQQLWLIDVGCIAGNKVAQEWKHDELFKRDSRSDSCHL